MGKDIRNHKGRSALRPDGYNYPMELNKWYDGPIKARVRSYIGRCDCEWCHSNRTYSSQRAQLSADMSLKEWLENPDCASLDCYEEFI